MTNVPPMDDVKIDDGAPEAPMQGPDGEGAVDASADEATPESKTTTRYRWRVLDAGPIMLDGGGMFGVIPRVVWTRFAEPDEKNRITLRHNCVLLESIPEGDEPVKRYLIETGTGDKLDAKMSSIFGLSDRTIETALGEAGVSADAIDAVIVSHLHFDHAGGLTRRVREDEEPDWIARKPGAASGDDPNVKLTFPNAELIVQKREWVDARANDAVMTRTYFRDHLLPFEDDDLKLADGRDRMRLVESQRPFPMNRKPGRDEAPKTRVSERETEVLPGVFVFLVPGHTWGQQAVRWVDDAGQEVVFTPDVLPTAWHGGQTFSLSYDVEPYTSMVTKRWFLGEAAERGWLLVLDHEPGDPLRRVREDGKGWFELVEAGTGG